jgi:flagellar hook-associated protein 1
MSDFGALNTALSALLSHRRASEVLGQNIANVNTEGYSRQRVDLSSQAGSVVPAVFSRGSGVGDGVKVDGIVRMRDDFLEKRSLTENGNKASLSRQVDMLRRIEMSFPEPIDTGLASQLADYWSAWDDVANTPDGVGARAQLLERATTVVSSFNRAATELTQLRDSANLQISAIVEEVNAQAARIAELNDAVRRATAGGLSANDLSDQRDTLVQRLASLTGATIRDGEFGMVDVILGGSALVRGIRFESLEVVTNQTAPPGSASENVAWNQTGLRWTKDQYPVSIGGGELHGLMNGINETMPRYLDALNNTARTLADQVNTIHSTGYDLDGNPGSTQFFSYFGNPTPPAPPQAATGWAERLQLGFNDPRLVAAAADPASPLDGSVAQLLARQSASPNGADASYRALISTLGVESQTIQRRYDIQHEVALQVDTERKSISGVNLDEEMISLTQTQHAYNAAARVITTIDGMLETLINMAR